MCFCFKKKNLRQAESTTSPKANESISIWGETFNKVSHKMSSWSLPKSNNAKEEFERQFTKYLALQSSGYE